METIAQAHTPAPREERKKASETKASSEPLNDEAAELKKHADESRKLANRPVNPSRELSKIPKFLKPSPPLSTAPEAEKEKYLEEKKEALSAYVALVESRGFEFLEPFNGRDEPQVRKISEIAEQD